MLIGQKLLLLSLIDLKYSTSERQSSRHRPKVAGELAKEHSQGGGCDG